MKSIILEIISKKYLMKYDWNMKRLLKILFEQRFFNVEIT